MIAWGGPPAGVLASCRKLGVVSLNPFQDVPIRQVSSNVWLDPHPQAYRSGETRLVCLDNDVKFFSKLVGFLTDFRILF